MSLPIAGRVLLFGLAAMALVVQNPFLHVERDGSEFAITYKPDMEWTNDRGPFVSDRGLLAPYRLTGRVLPASMIPEWRMAGPVSAGTPGMDEAEVEAFTGAVRAFLLRNPDKPLNLFVGCA